MANELRTSYFGATAPYGILRRQGDGFVWQTTTSTFVTPINANITNYDITLSSLGLDLWAADMPDADPGNFTIDFYDYVVLGTPATTDFKLPSGYDFYWNGTVTNPSPDPGTNPVGIYFTYDPGIKNILGQISAEIVSQLDNEVASADYTRIQNDGNLADAYTTRRARIADYLTPILSTSADFLLVQYVTNLYASFLLARHRAWFGVSATERDKLINLEGEARQLYDELFGEDPGGIDAPVTAGSGILAAQSGLAPTAGVAPSCCRPIGGQAIYGGWCL